jgi:hypothetical protein
MEPGAIAVVDIVWGRTVEESMQKSLVVISFAAGIGLALCGSAAAAPAAPAAVQEAATAASMLQPAQYSERRTRRGMVKCYRDLLIGPYRCHYYPNPL